MINQTDVLIGLVLFIIGVFLGTTRVGKTFAAVMVGSFIFNLCYSYWTLKDYVFWLSWNDQVIEAMDITINWFIYWLFKAIMLSLPPGAGYFVGLAFSGFDSRYDGRVV